MIIYHILQCYTYICIYLYNIFVMLVPEMHEKSKMAVIVRMRPLTNKQQQQISNYQSYVLHKKKNYKNKLSQSSLSFLNKYHHINIKNIIKVDQNHISVYDQQYKNFQTKMKDYMFSDIYDQYTSNGHIFDQSIKNTLNGLIQGYNSTILAYGITGSGKTFSVFGHPKLEKDKGLCYLASEFLLKKKKQYQKEKHIFNIKFSFLQIYNENVRDLLSQDGKKLVTIGEDIKGNISLNDALEIDIVCIQQLVHHISSGTQRRSSATTLYNQMSSRSHAVLKINIQIQKKNKKINSKLFIIDLAGSQKISIENSTRKHQGVNINKSLLTLGNCINALAENSKRPGFSHIPYRDSKLTRLLKDSLGGNSKIIMIACISPFPFSFQQTVTTLNYAQRAKGIKKQITKNIISSQFSCQKCQSNLFSPIKIKSFNSQDFPRQTYINAIPDKADNNIYDEQPLIIENQLLQRLYNDIVENAKQLQKMQRIKVMIKQPYNEYYILEKLNQEIQSNLKNTFYSLFKKHNSSTNLKQSLNLNSLANLKPSQHINDYKPYKKKIRLSNSSKKIKLSNSSRQIQKENISRSIQKESGSKASRSQQKNKQQLDQYLILMQTNKNYKNYDQKDHECLTSQRKRRSKVEIIKRPPLSNQYRKISIQKNNNLNSNFCNDIHKQQQHSYNKQQPFYVKQQCFYDKQEHLQ